MFTQKNNFNNDAKNTREDITSYLDLFINFKLKVEKAKELGYDTTSTFTNEFETYRKQLASPYLTETKVKENLIREAFQRMQYEVRAAHILVRLPDNPSPGDTIAAYNKILELRQKAESGEDFFQLAKQYSEDPSAANNNGDLGYFSVLQMVYPFENAAYDTPLGEISEIIRTKFGYHILKILDKRPSKGKVKVAHILLRTPPDGTDSAQVANKIFEIYDQLVSGEDWNTLCKLYSEDTRTRDNGGSLPFLANGQIDPQFADVAFSIKEIGQISDPFLTRYGWHILKLEERQEIGDFESAKEELEPKVRRDSRSALNEQTMLHQLKEKLNYKPDQTSLDYAFSRADSSLLNGAWRFNEKQVSLNDTLFTIVGTYFSINDFFKYAMKNQRVRRNLTPVSYMQALYEDFLYQCLLEAEMNNLEENNDEFRNLVNEYYEGILLFEIMEDMVWTKASQDSLGLQQFFEENRDQFVWNERVSATIYSASGQPIIEDIMNGFADEGEMILKKITLEGGSPDIQKSISTLTGVSDHKEIDIQIQGPDSSSMIDLKKYLVEQGIHTDQISLTLSGTRGKDMFLTASSRSKKSLEWLYNRESTLTLEVTEGVFEKEDAPILSQVEWAPGKYQLMSDGRYYLVVIDKLVPPQPKELEKVKGTVISKYQDFLESEWVSELKEKYKVVIDQKVLKRLY